jgi:hypothetical protein
VKQLFYRPSSGKVYFGEGKPSKNNPGVTFLSGEKIDVTRSFYDCLLHKFMKASSFIIKSIDDEPMYKLTIERIPEGK